MAIHESTSCPVDPASPVFYILADGIKRFAPRADELCWRDLPPEEGRIVSYEPFTECPVLRLANASASAAGYASAEGWAALRDDPFRAVGLFASAEAALGAAIDLLEDADDDGEHRPTVRALRALEVEARRGHWRACLRYSRNTTRTN
ncbi:hypothetical protein HLB44_25425 [Aquincola sp. S2]|uniref:Uncharacterized protein n=1 Tax=Pseudaquabacterium terrae TaxID=2732868 RepID=A0ABX2ENY2_9BURK|nr:hypothetical protein [Aquabacterium terrae]NRF70355.1 hypothetical protein [Aquabacterium terrae]